MHKALSSILNVTRVSRFQQKVQKTSEPKTLLQHWDVEFLSVTLLHCVKCISYIWEQQWPKYLKETRYSFLWEGITTEQQSEAGGCQLYSVAPLILSMPPSMWKAEPPPPPPPLPPPPRYSIIPSGNTDTSVVFVTSCVILKQPITQAPVLTHTHKHIRFVLTDNGAIGRCNLKLSLT